MVQFILQEHKIPKDPKRIKQLYRSDVGWKDKGVYNSFLEAANAKLEHNNPNKLYRVIPTGTIRILNIIEQTMADGPGLRNSVYGAGCIHNCLGCHNPESHDPNGGTEMDIRELAKRLLEQKNIDVTFSGGDPLYQVDEFTALAQLLKRYNPKINIWCYTGYTYEYVYNHKKLAQILPYIDVLVDGKFELDKRDTHDFKGSTNQRIIYLEDLC